MKLSRVLTLAVCLCLAMLAIVPAFAQGEEYPVLILPVDRANFLPGSYFDFRVEVHTRTLPDNFAITVNGEDAAAYFSAEPTEETWEFGGGVTRFNNSGTAGADFTADALAGEYYNATFGTVVVAVAGDAVTAAIGGEEATLTATEGDALSYTVTGGAADGQTATFGLNADGAVTGFQVAGQTFGLLTGDLPTPSTSLIWRGLTAPEAGEYTVEVTAGATTQTVNWIVREAGTGNGARNVILFVADGMSVPTITAARIASRGITQGTLDGEFNMDQAEAIGLAHTSSIDSLMADSANTASALNTGHIGSVNATGTYSDTSPSRLDDPRVETFGEMVSRLRGMSVGTISTSDWTDATPAAVFAHGRDRSDANRAAFAVQPLELGLLPEVIMGGGSRRLLPQTTEGSRRTDDRDVFAEYEAAGYTIVTSRTELDALAATSGMPERVLGVFAPSDLNVWLDRNVYTENLGDNTDQPGLVEMTLASLDILNQNPNGFYLAIEAASVDKQLHPLDQERALSDLIEFDEAIGAAMAWVEENAPDTLIVITSDHSHGYDVYGTVDTEAFNAGTDDISRRAAIRTYAAAGYPTYSDADGDNYPDWEAGIVFAGVVNNHPEYTEDFQVSPVPRAPGVANDEGIIVDNPEDDPNGIFMSGNLDPRSGTGVHTLQDVPVFAMGPGADFFMGVYHQREIFFGMAEAIGLNPAAEAGMMDGDMMATDEAMMDMDATMEATEEGMMMEATPEATQGAAAPSDVAAAGFSLPAGTAGLMLLVGLVGGFAISRVFSKKN